ncbi:MAG: ABC transporter substrate-binding protein [Lachnospiraceae bacterium]|nr:ABC transporter substrate-binding protein [Lachnospiraceae bacterium]
MQKKRMVAFALSLCMVMSILLGGCSQPGTQKETDKQETQGTAAAGTEAKETEGEPELEPYEVTYWIYGSDSKDCEKIEEEANKLIQEKLPNTTLDLVWVAASEYKEKWNKALAAEEKIDIGWSANWVNPVSTDVYNGVVTPVEDLLLEYGEGIVEAVGGWDVMNLHRSLDGELYFIPCWQGMVGNRYGILVNQKLADLMPEGWMAETENICFENDEFTVEDKTAIMDRIEMLFKTEADNNLFDPTPAKDALSRVLLTGTLSTNYTVGVSEKDGVYTVFSWFDNDVFKYYGDKLHEWWEKGYFRSDILSAKVSVDENMPLWGTGAISDAWVEEQEIKRGFALDGFKLNENNEFITGFATGCVIPYTSENPERAMQVLNLIYTDAELYQLLVYGIKGEHYVENVDGTITRPVAADRKYAGVTNWTIGSCIYSLPEAKNAIGYYDDLKKQEETAVQNPLLGFSFDSTNVKEQANALGVVRKEMQYCMFQENWEEAYEDFIAKLDKAGFEDYIKEYKSQLKEYVESNNLGTVAD